VDMLPPANELAAIAEARAQSGDAISVNKDLQKFTLKSNSRRRSLLGTIDDLKTRLGIVVMLFTASGSNPSSTQIEVVVSQLSAIASEGTSTGNFYQATEAEQMLAMAKSIADGLQNPPASLVSSLLNIATYAQVSVPESLPALVPMLAEMALRSADVGDDPIELVAVAATMVVAMRAGSTDDSAVNMYSPTASTSALEIPSNFFADDEREVDVHVTFHSSAPVLPTAADSDTVVVASEAVAMQVYHTDTQAPYDFGRLQEVTPFKISISHGTPTDGTTSAGQRYDATTEAWTSDGCEMDFASSTQATTVFVCKKGSFFRVVEKPIKESLTIMDTSALEGDDLVLSCKFLSQCRMRLSFPTELTPAPRPPGVTSPSTRACCKSKLARNRPPSSSRPEGTLRSKAPVKPSPPP